MSDNNPTKTAFRRRWLSILCNGRRPASRIIPIRTRFVGRLTPREVEVAILVAHGLTNKQIAARLVIAPRTADNHVQHIFDKLGLSSRSQVAAWVALEGLLAIHMRGTAA